MLSRRNFLTLVGTTVVAPAQTPKPNVLLILADDFGYESLGRYSAGRRTAQQILFIRATIPSKSSDEMMDSLDEGQLGASADVCDRTRKSRAAAAERVPGGRDRIVPTIPLRKIRGRTKWLIESDYAANNLPMNFAWAMGSLLASHLTLPFLTMSIASIPRKVRHAVGSEP
jgi:hypothetical protein